MKLPELLDIEPLDRPEEDVEEEEVEETENGEETENNENDEEKAQSITGESEKKEPSQAPSVAAASIPPSVAEEPSEHVTPDIDQE